MAVRTRTMAGAAGGRADADGLSADGRGQGRAWDLARLETVGAGARVARAGGVRAIRFLSLLAAAAVACGPGQVSGPGDEEGLEVDPGRVTVHRLNNTEYNNTVRDLLGTSLRPADDFPTDDQSYGFDNIADVLSVSPVQVELYHRAAVTLAADVMTSAPDRVLVCSPDPADPAPCVRTIARQFGRRAWRRPLTEEEVEEAVALFQVALDSGGDASEGVRLLVEHFLASPGFLFRFEIDPDPDAAGVRPLRDHELASRLSYFLWSSMPDDELLDVADAGRLVEPEELARQIERMMADPRADALVDNFAGQWLYLRGLAEHEPDADLFPGFDGALRAAMIAETADLFRTFLHEDRPIPEMLTAALGAIDERLAAHYGEQAASRRRGLLGHASILTVTSYPNRTSPVKRGKWVLEQLLCSEPPPPPPGVEGLDDQGPVTGSVRERMEQHRTDPVCAGCHQAMDPIGFALEHFDATGAWRETDSGYEIDATGTLPDGATFDGAVELGAVLAADPRFTRCLSEKMLIYALGRGLDERDAATVDRIHDQLVAGGGHLADLIALVATSEPFLYRRAEPTTPAAEEDSP